MNKINEVLKENNLNPKGYQKIGKCIIINTKDDKYVFKDTKINQDILIYLKSRNFDYMPYFLESEEYQLTRYVEDLSIPKEKKVLDMAKIIGLLHSKTTFYKEIDQSEYENLYADLDGNLNYLYNHYTELITIIESKVFPSPKEQILSTNISKIYDTISNNKKKLDQWRNLVKEKTKKRKVIVHDNLKLEHFILSDKPYLISWDKSKIDSPVFDIYKFYNNHALDFDFEPILKTYENVYPLSKDEKLLLDILISMPLIVDLKGKMYDDCVEIKKMLDRIYKAEKLSPKASEEREEHKNANYKK